MQRPAIEENLLFVVLALQNDFLDRDQLVDVLGAWSMDKKKSIAEVMIEKGVVSKDDHGVLELLVRRQAQKYGVQESILKSPTVTHLLKSIQAVADEELKESLKLFMAQESNPNEATQSYGQLGVGSSTMIDLEAMPPSGFDRYRIVRPHAKGGLGEVFVAHDEELDREVALKEIQPRFAKDTNSFLRFVVEARITGGLEHPGVVPIYGFGRYPDGRPFYAMRFIKGETLKEAIEAYHGPSAPTDPGKRRLAFRNLIRRLIDACNAIGYAHNRGVLHRDLKPANIMLGKFGETMVVDWGLAKVVGRREIHASSDESTLMPTSGSFVSATLAGSAMGTPAFMPPEQAEGRLDDMAPESDVYSLGATLYVILTGRPAFDGDTVEGVLTAVKANKFSSPREVGKDVPPALDAVCRKAMSGKPSDRYRSTMELAAELEHWLADEPVAAYPEPVHVRAGRWLRRHRTFASALSVLLATGAIASSIGMVLVNNERKNTVAAWEKVSEEKDRTDLALKGESSARKQTRNALTTVTDDLVGQAMARQAVLSDGDRAYLKRVLEQFQEFTKEGGDSAESRSLRAEGFLRVANLQRRLGELDASADAYKQAKSLLEILCRNDPENSAYKRDLIATLTNEGILLYDLGKYREAVANYEAVLEPLKSMAESPDAHKSRWELAKLHGNRANALSKLGDFDRAEKAYAAALDSLGDSYSELLTNPYAQQDYARILSNFAAFLVDRGGRDAEAERHYRQAVGELEKLVRATKGAPSFRHDLAVARGNLGKLLVTMTRFKEALVELKPAVEIETDLRSQFPVLAVHRQELGKAKSFVGAAMAGLDQPGYEEEFKAAISLLSALVAEHPNQPEFQRDLANAHDMKGLNLKLPEKQKDAIAAFNAARPIRKAVADADPADVRLRYERLGTEINLANLVRKLGAWKQAAGLYQAIANQAAEHPRLPRIIFRQVDFGLGDSLMHVEDFAEALPCWERLVKDRADSDWTVFELQRAIAMIRLGRVEEGMEAAAAVLARPDVKPTNHYDVACCCSLASAAAKVKPADGERLAKQAIRHLEDAVKAGFFKQPEFVGHIHKDADMNPLRPREDFKEFVKRHGL